MSSAPERAGYHTSEDEKHLHRLGEAGEADLPLLLGQGLAQVEETAGCGDRDEH